MQVKLGGVLFPLDCTCGAGMTLPHLQFSTNYTIEYFASHPEKLILTHFPDEPQLQLLAVPLLPSEVELLIAPPLTCFSYGIKPQTWGENITVEAGNNMNIARIQFKAPSTLPLLASLSVNSDTDLYSTHNLSQSQLQQATYIYRNEDDKVEVLAAVPTKGEYTLNIIAHTKKNEVLLSYQIYCTKKSSVNVGFPTVFSRAAASFGFKPLYWNTPKMAHICEIDEGKLEVVFQSDPNLQFHHFLVPGIATSLDINTDIDAQNFCTTVTQDPKKTSLHKLSAIFPKKGWWTVYLYAAKTTNITESETSGYTSLLSYPVLVKNELRKCSYPHTLSSEVRFEQSDPIYSDGSEILVIPFFTIKNLHFYSYMSYNDIDGQQENIYTHIQSLDGLSALNEFQYVLKVVFPKPGKWFVQVSAHDVAQPLDLGYVSLFQLFFDVTGCIKNTIFPIVVEDVIEKCDMQFSRSDPICFNDDEQPFCFHFLAPNNINFTHQIHTKNSNDSMNAFDDHSTFLCFSNADEKYFKYTLKAIFPREGNWNVSIFARKQMLSEPQLAIQIPFYITKPFPDRIFPNIYHAYHDFRIEIPDENIPFEKFTNEPEFIFPFFCPENIHFAWSLEDVVTNEQSKFSAQTFMQHIYNQTSKQNRQLRLIFPKPGCWRLRVFGKSILKDIVADAALSLSLNYQPLFDVLIQASNASLSHMAFPIIYEPFHSQFRLKIESDDLPLPAVVRRLPVSCTIRFYGPADVKFWHEGKEFDQFSDNQMTRMMSSDTGLRHLEIEISKPGRWVVNLYAKKASDGSKNWIPVLKHTITATTHGRRSSTKH